MTSETMLGNGPTAATTNVAICMRAAERAISRPAHLPGITAFYGPSGYGKSMGAAFAATKYRAYYVELKESWTAKAFLQKTLQVMRVTPERTVYQMADQASEQLALAQNGDRPRPLIIDEFDYAIKKGYVDVVRDLYEASGGAPILLIGEEMLEGKLRKWERMHNRILDWFPAQPATIADVRRLADMYCPKTKVADDLLERLLQATRGVTRRICVNLDRVAEFAAANPAADDKGVTLAQWGNRDIYTGEALRRRPL